MKRERSAAEVKEGPWIVKFKDNHALLPFYLALEGHTPPFSLMGGILNWVFQSRPEVALQKSPEAYRKLKELEKSGLARELALEPFEGGPNIPSNEEARDLLKQFDTEWQQEREFADMLKAAKNPKAKTAKGSTHGS